MSFKNEWKKLLGIIAAFAVCYNIPVGAGRFDNAVSESLAVYNVTALPSTVFGKSEGGIEQWLNEEKTLDGRKGAIVQIWVNYGKKAKENLLVAKKSAEKNMSGEFIALDLRNAENSLAEIIGTVTTDDILNNVFSKFCIGK